MKLAQKYFDRTSLILISIFLYFLILYSPALIPVSRYFGGYSYLLFFLVFSFYSFSFLIKGKLGFLLGLFLTVSLYAFMLLNKWSTGFSDNMLIGGLLPYKDAKYYYLGAEMILDGLPIAANSIQAAGRPLFPGFLSTFLFVVQGNLQWALALIFLCAGLCSYFAARQMFKSYGVFAGGLFATFLYLYIRPLIGFTLSESGGFIFGGLAYLILWNSAQKLNRLELIAGLVVLTFAVSIRSGAFFILPILILWAGWVFRNNKRYSLSFAGIAALAVFVSFVIVNVIYPRLTVEPGAVTFGNFAYTLYGQVQGGVGWHRAIAETGTRDPGIIMKQAISFFLQHPLSFFIAAAKSYRDFFFGDIGLFEFMATFNGITLQSVIWLLQWILLVAGLIRSLRKAFNPVHSLLLASFVGTVFSIPFLPPIDGGSRFYASSIIYMFALTSMSLAKDSEHATFKTIEESRVSGLSVLALMSLVFISVVVVFPVIMQRVYHPDNYVSAPICTGKEEPFVAKISKGSYINLVLEGECGLAPNICFNNFLENGTEKSIDDFYQEIVAQAITYDRAMRVALFTNTLDGEYYYLIGTPVQMDILHDQLIVGCATRIRTKNQSIYKIQNIINQ